MTSYKDYLAVRGYVRQPVQVTTKRPGDLVLTSSRVVQVVCFDRGGRL